MYPTISLATLSCLFSRLSPLSAHQNEDSEDDASKAVAAGCCLTVVALVVGNDMIQAPSPVLAFIESNIQSANWRQREAATMAFGAPLCSASRCSPLPLFPSALPLPPPHASPVEFEMRRF